jgi:hypothetical protein
MSKSIKVLRYFDKIEGGQVFDEEQFRALKHGDMILVQLDGPQPEIRKFTGFGLRSPLIATLYRGVRLHLLFCRWFSP